MGYRNNFGVFACVLRSWNLMKQCILYFTIFGNGKINMAAKRVCDVELAVICLVLGIELQICFFT